MNEQVENRITLRSVFKFPKVTVEPAIDPNTNRYAPHVRRVDSNGDMIVSDAEKSSGAYLIAENENIDLYDGKVFDLDDPYDKAWWDAIKMSKRIVQDRWVRNHKGDLVIDGNALRYGSAELYVERAGQQATLRVNTRKEKHEAEQFIFNDSKDGLYMKARLLGSPMNSLPIGDVEEYLLDVASKDPEKIKNLYTGDDTHLRILLINAIEKYIIKFGKDRLYIYGEHHILGASQDAVISWFKNPTNKRLLDMIKQDTYPEDYKELPVDVDETISTEDLINAVKRGKR